MTNTLVTTVIVRCVLRSIAHRRVCSHALCRHVYRHACGHVDMLAGMPVDMLADIPVDMPVDMPVGMLAGMPVDMRIKCGPEHAVRSRCSRRTSEAMGSMLHSFPQPRK